MQPTKTFDISLTDIDYNPTHFAMTASSPKGKQSMWNKFGNGAVEAIVPLQNLEQVKSVLRDEGLEVENRVADVRHVSCEMSECGEFSVGGRMFFSLPNGMSLDQASLVPQTRKCIHDDSEEITHWEAKQFSNYYGFEFEFVIFND